MPRLKPQVQPKQPSKPFSVSVVDYQHGGLNFAMATDTIDEAIKQMVATMTAHAKSMYPSQVSKNITIRVEDAERLMREEHRHEYLNADGQDLSIKRSRTNREIAEFCNKEISGSRKFICQFFLFETNMGMIHGVIQDHEKVKKFLQTPDMIKLQQILGQLGANSVTGNGIFLKGKKP